MDLAQARVLVPDVADHLVVDGPQFAKIANLYRPRRKCNELGSKVGDNWNRPIFAHPRWSIFWIHKIRALTYDSISESTYSKLALSYNYANFEGGTFADGRGIVLFFGTPILLKCVQNNSSCTSAIAHVQSHWVTSRFLMHQIRAVRKIDRKAEMQKMVQWVEKLRICSRNAKCHNDSLEDGNRMPKKWQGLFHSLTYAFS